MGVEIDPTLGVDNDITAAINAIASAEGINPAELADGTFAGELNTNQVNALIGELNTASNPLGEIIDVSNFTITDSTSAITFNNGFAFGADIIPYQQSDNSYVWRLDNLHLGFEASATPNLISDGPNYSINYTDPFSSVSTQVSVSGYASELRTDFFTDADATPPVVNQSLLDGLTGIADGSASLFIGEEINVAQAEVLLSAMADDGVNQGHPLVTYKISDDFSGILRKYLHNSASIRCSFNRGPICLVSRRPAIGCL